MASDSANRTTTIGQLAPGMKNLNVTFIVVDVGAPRRTQQGHDIRTIRVADISGSILMCVWDTVAEVIRGGEIWRLRNGYTSVFRGALGLSCGRAGDLTKVGEFFMVFNELPNMSEYSAELAAKYPTTRRGSPGDENGGGGNGDPKTDITQNFSTGMKTVNNGGGGVGASANANVSVSGGISGAGVTAAGGGGTFKSNILELSTQQPNAANAPPPTTAHGNRVATGRRHITVPRADDENQRSKLQRF